MHLSNLKIGPIVSRNVFWLLSIVFKVLRDLIGLAKPITQLVTTKSHEISNFCPANGSHLNTTCEMHCKHSLHALFPVKLLEYLGLLAIFFWFETL